MTRAVEQPGTTAPPMAEGWPWPRVEDTAYVSIPCWVCGRQGDGDRPEAVVRVAGRGIEQDGGVRFAVPFARLGVLVPGRIFGGPYGIGMGEGSLGMLGRDANELRERVRSGWTGIEGVKPFVPRVPTEAERATEAGKYADRRRLFVRGGTWAND